jgi:hypothetical protein
MSVPLSQSGIGKAAPADSRSPLQSSFRQSPQLACGELELFQDVCGAPEQQLARGSESERAMAVWALDQAAANALLERGDLLADRRLREHQAPCRAAERAFLCNRAQRQKVPELDAKPGPINAGGRRAPAIRGVRLSARDADCRDRLHLPSIASPTCAPPGIRFSTKRTSAAPYVPPHSGLTQERLVAHPLRMYTRARIPHLARSCTGDRQRRSSPKHA